MSEEAISHANRKPDYMGIPDTVYAHGVSENPFLTDREALFKRFEDLSKYIEDDQYLVVVNTPAGNDIVQGVYYDKRDKTWFWACACGEAEIEDKITVYKKVEL